MAFRYLDGLDRRQPDAVLAALRLLASALPNRLVLPGDGDVGDILTNACLHRGLTADEVDDLADDFACEPVSAPIPPDVVMVRRPS